MTAERWARIKEIFGEALEKPEADRHAYLDSACGGDAELRGEVEKLLEGSEEASLRSPAADLLAHVAELAPGEMLAHYRVEAKLGEGGMGAVYRAYDTSLHRQVALKVLAPELHADPDGRRRLVREARAASALNHPNIVTVHEIGSDRGVDFIAMEYVEGRSLAQLIPPKGLPVKRALAYAIAIADGLAQAHAAGVVHRDLKPGNVMVNATGQVKLLDFGLARRVRLPEGETRSLTVEGEIAGTPAYMSPEQAEGKKTDERTDVFAFGAVLYEMLSGRRAFSGDSTLAVLGAVLREDPPPLSGVPREVERLVSLCLRKDPVRRLRNIDDVRTQLEALKEETAALEPVAAPPKRRRWLLTTTLAIVLAAAIGSALWLDRSRKPDAPPEMVRLTSDSGLTTDPALSPDGKLLAYASDRAGEGNLDIWVQQIGGGAPIRLTRDAANKTAPDFSPDGTQVAFRSEREGGGIYVVPALGGEPRLIASQGFGPRFSPDGSQIAYSASAPVVSSQGNSIHVLASSGGQARRLAPDFFRASDPLWTPDGKHLLFVGTREVGGAYDWWVTSLNGGPAIQTGTAGVLPRERASVSYTRGFAVSAPSGWLHEDLLFSEYTGESINLWRVPFSTKTWRVTGKPRQLSFGTGVDFHARVSANGQVVFASLIRNVNIWSLPVDTNRGAVTGELQRLTQGAGSQREPCLSPDGKTLAFIVNQPSTGQLILKDLASGKETPVFEVPRGGGYPAFSADGSKIAFSSGEGEKRSIHVLPVAGGVPEAVCEHCGLAPAWSSDGSRILYDWGIPRYVALLQVTTGKSIQVLKHPMDGLFQGRFSPDDRWVSFSRGRASGRTQVMVAPFQGAAEIPESQWIPVTDGSANDMRPRWSPDGNLLYFISDCDGFQCLWARRLDPATRRPVGASFAVHHFHSASLTLSAAETYLGFTIGRDRIAMSLQERTGNIWTFKLPDR